MTSDENLTIACAFDCGYQQGYDDGASDERKKIVSFLNLCGGEFANKYADWIEAGEHLK